ncbi:neuronal acetylcholine receptor subunit beta-2-like isoform X2 [Mizuhopecten yessoensis]|uniref:Neuronal acetylcholine receptor subunit alpha-6 n=1 Tax=Mizuhopecten yessoensis TaxID=6573 RepID=A0A210Q8A0_MIZYE|nr:neuronal acetylcholine receptor subunit beta-2-like isoform X2 [Mizuhopecten yessoensis]OWF44951.1 Neuronal acetylcholine receptor subunit alpha-6 [Mizuhopecten yessoensis]
MQHALRRHTCRFESGTTDVRHAISWKDYRLEWDPQEYGGVKQIILPASQVWYPKIVLLTGMSNIQQVGSEEFDIYVEYTGTVIWAPGGVLMSSCKANMRDFPRDYQTCMLILNNMVYDKEEMRLVPGQSFVDMEFYTKNGEWEVIWTKVSNKVDRFEKLTSISFVSITIGIIRKSEYFVITMLIPVAVLCVLDAFVFMIPVGASDRVGFSLTLFLALTVYMSVMGSFLPTTSEPLAGMTYFLLASEIHCTFVILMTIVTIRLYDREHLPEWLVRLYRLPFRKSRQSKQQKNADESYENIPLDKGARESAQGEDSEAQTRRSLLSILDKFLFIFFLSTMVLMSIVFFSTYLNHDHDHDAK